MEKNQERSDKIRTVFSSLLALALVAFFSWPGSAAIKRFTDEKGNLVITNEGPASTSQTTTAIPAGPSSRIRSPRAFPGPVTDPQPPPHVEPPGVQSAPEPEDTGPDPEEPPEEPAPAQRGR